MGKSGLVANIAENVAVEGQRPVAFFSLEMSETELAHRFIAWRARIPSDKLRKGEVDDATGTGCSAPATSSRSAPLWIDESSDLSMLDLRGKARRLHRSASARRRPRPDHRRLHPAHARRGPADEPRRAGRADEPRAEDPGARAQGAGDRPLAALPRARAAAAATSGRCSPTCASRATSSRTPTSSPSSTARTTTATGRVGRRRRARAAQGDRRADRPQEPQRPDRHGRAGVPRGLRVVPSTKARGLASGRSSRAPGEGPPLVERRRRVSAQVERLRVAAGPVCPRRVRRRRLDRRRDEVAHALRVPRSADSTQARTRGRQQALPARYRGVSFDRPPVSDMARDLQSRTRRRAGPRLRRRSRRKPRRGRGLWLTGDVGTGKTTLAMLVSKAAIEAGHSGRDLLAAPPAGADPPHLRRRGRRGLLPRSSSTASPRSTCSTSTTSAPRSRRDWVLEQLYAIVDERYQSQRAMVVTTNLLDLEELERAGGRAHGLAAGGDCASPLPLYGARPRATRRFRCHPP